MFFSRRNLQAVARHGRIASGLAALLVCSVVFTACARKDAGPPPRYAFIGFENLSGDPSLEWAGRGAGEFLSRSLRDALSGSGGGNDAVLSMDAIGRAAQSLGARAAGAPGLSSARDSAIAAGANRIVTGYIERTPAGVRITASEEDAATHKTVRTLSATASSPFEALSLLAHEFSSRAGNPGTANAQAFRLYCTALEGPAANAAPLLEQAVKLDPDFGRAWLVLARTYAVSGDRARAADVIAQARARKIAPIDRAWLDFENAALGGDRSASLAAMRKVSELDAADTGLARTLADAETAAGNFLRAAGVWKRLTADNPSDTSAWNQLGYSLCWGGDYPGALAALSEYARLRPADGNPLDSEGDVQYWFGKFADAAASYAAAYAKTPEMLNGGDLYKGAWAKFHAGDKTGAETLFGKFKNVREKNKDQAIGIVAGDWLYRTGRAREAVALLRNALKNEAAGGSPVIRAEIAAQLAVWDLLAGDRASAAGDIADGGAAGLTPSDVVIRFAAMPTAPVSEWEARAAHILAAPQLAGLRNTALGYALILDGKKQAAIPLWEEIVKQSPATDFFVRDVLTRLEGARVEHAAPPDPMNLNPFAALPGKL